MANATVGKQEMTGKPGMPEQPGSSRTRLIFAIRI